MIKLLQNIAGFLISIPARIKGMTFGKGSFIAPGYDFLFVNLKKVTLGKNVLIGQNAWIANHGKGQVNIDNNTSIGRNCVISAAKRIQIGKNCLISYGVSIIDNEHIYSKKISPITNRLGNIKEIIIGDGCFIGAHSFILKGARLGTHCVVGANSVVTKSFPKYSVIAGNPATLIKKL